MTREETQRVFSGYYREVVRFDGCKGTSLCCGAMCGDPRRPLSDGIASHGDYEWDEGDAAVCWATRSAAAGDLSESGHVESRDPSAHTRCRSVGAGAGRSRVAEGFPHPKFLICIVSVANRTEIQAVIRFAREQGFLPVVGAYHWNVGTYGRPDELLMSERSSAVAVFRGLLDDELIPSGYLRKFIEDSVSWLRGGKLEPCDAGLYSLAIDASGNVLPCSTFPFARNLLESSLNEILEGFDRAAITVCFDHSSCNRLNGRVVGTIFRHPIIALRTTRSCRS